jgi:hypothetical protein
MKIGKMINFDASIASIANHTRGKQWKPDGANSHKGKRLMVSNCSNNVAN